MVRNNHEMPRCLLVQTNREVYQLHARFVAGIATLVGGAGPVGMGVLWALSGAGAQLTHPGHSEIAVMDFSKGSDPDEERRVEDY